MEEIIQEFTNYVANMEYYKEDMDDVSWDLQEGILISGNEAKKIIEFYNKHKDHE